MNRRHFTYEIVSDDKHLTVIDFLRCRGFSRHLLIQMKKERDCIYLNNTPLYEKNNYHQGGNTLLNTGDVLDIYLPHEESSSHILPSNLQFEIFYEDDDLLVINKSAGIPIHPSIGHYEDTLANAVMWYYTRQGRPFVFRCINRLDRDTSGLLIIAKNALSGSILSEQMLNRQIHRQYLAIVKGVPSPKSGVIKAPIARASDSVIERCVDFDKGEYACTNYECLASAENQSYSLVSLKLDTGRTHQIRVHMKYIGNPLPGDFLYCPDYTDYTRQPLHSWKLQFIHPITKEVLSFVCPLPNDFLVEKNIGEISI